MSAARHWEQDKEATLYVGNIDERLSDALVWELMMQMGPVVNVHLPKDRVTQQHQGYGFVEYASPQDADYAEQVMNGVRVWEKPLRVNKASADRRTGPDGVPGGGQSVGAELFVGNLDSLVDEKILFDTFSRFGPFVAAPKVARDDSNLSKGYGFISYASFQSSDDAIANMHGQYLMNKEVTVQYAYKKDGKGERHGDPAERALAEQAKQHGVQVNLPAMPAALTGTPSGPAAMQGGPVQRPPSGFGGAFGGFPNYGAAGYPQPGGYGGGYPAYGAQPGFPPQPPSFPPQNNFGGFPPPGQPNFPPGFNPPQAPAPPSQPPRQYNQSPLQAPPSGLPARPPPSTAGYGGPMGAPGMPQAPPGNLPPPPPGLPRAPHAG